MSENEIKFPAGGHAPSGKPAAPSSRAPHRLDGAATFKKPQWSEDLSKRLADLWKDHTGGQIVEILNAEGYSVTRSSVLGRLNRMKLLGTGITRGPQTKPRKRKSLAGQATAAPPSPDPKVQVVVHRRADGAEYQCRQIDVETRKIPMLELKSTDCRYAVDVDEQGRHLFCGRFVKPFKSYCQAHHDLCWKSVQARREPFRFPARAEVRS